MCVRHLTLQRSIASSSSSMPRPGLSGTSRQPSAFTCTGSASMKSRRSGSSRAGRRELEVRAAADAGRDMQVGEHADAVGPAVRRELTVLQVCELGECAGAVHADREEPRPSGRRRGRPPPDSAAVQWASGASRRRRCARPVLGAQPLEAVQVRVRQRLLHPEHVEFGEPGDGLAGLGQVGGVRRVTGHPPGLVEVDHDLEVVAQFSRERPGPTRSPRDAVAVDADLHGPEAGLAHLQRRRHPLPRDFSSPEEAYAGSRLAALPNSSETGRPCTLPMTSHRAASSGQ